MAVASPTRSDGGAQPAAGGSFGAEARAAAFTALLEDATDHAVLTLDRDGRITSWSIGARELLGWDEAAAVGRSTESIFTPEDCARGEPEAEIATALAAGRAACDHWFVRRDGSRIWGSGTLTPMRDPAGAVIGFVKVLRDRTEQRGERERLAAEAEVLGSVTDGICALDDAGRFTFANASALALWGKRADEVLGRHYLDVLPEASIGAEAHAAYRQAAARRHPVHVETRAPASGRWHSVSFYPAASGGVAAYFRDITDRKLAESELLRARQFAQRVADISPAIVYVFDYREMRNVYVNREVIAVLGYTPEEIAAFGPDLMAGLLHPDDLPRQQAQVRLVAALTDGRTVEWEYRMRRADGEWRWFLGRDAPFDRDPAGAVVQVIGAALDITDRKLAEAALQASEERHRLAMRAIDAMVFDWDVPSGTVRRSDGLSRLLGFEPGEVEPTAAWWRSRVHPDDARERGRPAERAMERGAERFEVEHRVLHRDGRWIDVLDTGYVLYGPDDRPLRAVGSSVDVTERRRAEAAIRERNLRLEILAEAAARLISGDDTDAAVGGLFRSVAERLGVDFCLSFSADAAAGVLRLEDHVGVPEEALGGFAQVEYGRTVCGVVAQLRQPAYVVSVQASGDPLTAYLRALGVRAYASYPLLADGRLLGTLSFASRRRDRFDDEELAFFRTVSHHVAAVRERGRAEEALRESEERFRQFAEYSADVLWIADAAAVRLEYVSPAYERVWGEPRDPVLRDLGHWAARVHPDDRDAAARGLPRVLAGESLVQDYRIVRPDGGVRWIRDTGFPIPNPDGTTRRVAGIAQDVTETKRHEHRQAVLVAELQHRVKNILANVQSLARQTRGRSRTLDEFATAFGGRLDALARTQKLLTRTPDSRASLRDIVRGEVAAYDGDGGRVEVGGPEVTLGAGRAQSLQLAIHELATNAAKYGAFATDDGRLEVAWGLEPDPEAAGGDLLRLRWRETGVRIADLTPARGFGSDIIEGSLPYMLGGTASLAFHPDGAECVVAFPFTRKGQEDDGET